MLIKNMTCEPLMCLWLADKIVPNICSLTFIEEIEFAHFWTTVISSSIHCWKIGYYLGACWGKFDSINILQAMQGVLEWYTCSVCVAQCTMSYVMLPAIFTAFLWDTKDELSAVLGPCCRSMLLIVDMSWFLLEFWGDNLGRRYQ